MYFSCSADIDAKGFPVYLFGRPSAAKGENVSAQLVEALEAYLQGPTPAEAKRGYVAAVPTPFLEALAGVSVDGDLATVNFAPVLQERVKFTATRGLVFLRELEATVFQFEQIQRLSLAIAGDCESFWRMFEGSCRVIQRSP